ncbi:hypothetical protein COCON_G00168660 [Conger conger]|uniref:Uncharacterized protein n=1 Tax=Conger conger TaxID=82655 RepID=A0A9Q1D7C8_CONCO|nr:hypothetical protein COCON_G00168660 [Conger conger]
MSCWEAADLQLGFMPAKCGERGDEFVHLPEPPNQGQRAPCLTQRPKPWPCLHRSAVGRAGPSVLDQSASTPPPAGRRPPEAPLCFRRAAVGRTRHRRVRPSSGREGVWQRWRWPRKHDDPHSDLRRCVNPLWIGGLLQAPGQIRPGLRRRASSCYRSHSAGLAFGPLRKRSRRSSDLTETQEIHYTAQYLQSCLGSYRRRL